MVVHDTTSFHVMAKPIGPICNLDCAYCYYLHKRDLLRPSGTGSWRMSDHTLELFIRQYIEAQRTPYIQFAWQGGEPTLLGLAFFEKVIELQRRYCPAGKTIQNALQTNGTLIDDQWAAFLKAHDFLVGISIDGPREIHDRYRLDKAGRASFDQVMRGRACLVKHGVPHNALVCINRDNGDKLREVYRFLRKERFQWIQFIPVVEPRDFETRGPGAQRPAFENPEDAVTAWSVLPEQYGTFLITVFDQWVRQDIGQTFVQLFEECAAIWVGGQANLCIFQPTCGKAMAIEHDGTLFSCDHYVYPQYRLGNIHETHIGDLFGRPYQRQFGQQKADALPGYCRQCEVRFACNGGCPKDRFMTTPDGERGLHYLCPAYKRFFKHVDPHMRTLAHLIRHGRPATDLSQIIRAQARGLPKSAATKGRGARRTPRRRRRGSKSR